MDTSPPQEPDRHSSHFAKGSIALRSSDGVIFRISEQALQLHSTVWNVSNTARQPITLLTLCCTGPYRQRPT